MFVRCRVGPLYIVIVAQEVYLKSAGTIEETKLVHLHQMDR